MSDLTRDVLTFITFGLLALPSIIGVLWLLRRVLQIMGLFNRANTRLRNRFVVGKVFLAATVISLFLSFQGWWEMPIELRALVFMITFICLGETIGWMFLAWNLWWYGLDRNQHQPSRIVWLNRFRRYKGENK